MKKIISNILSIGIVILLVGTIIFVYNKYYFNDFSKAQEYKKVTSFYRDSKNKCTENSSFCIESTDYNDAIFFKSISVEKNTPYKITCKIKTEGVESTNSDTSGACISLMDTADQTIPLQGTNDWQEVTLLVDSQNSENLRIGFRLGGYEGYSKGKVWFSDMHVEKGTKDPTKDWNVACFLIDNVNFNVNDVNRTYSLTDEDKELLASNMERFSDTCEEFSNGAMRVSYEIVEITEPLTSFSYDDENYYYVAPSDIKPLIDEYVKENEYDHIFIGIRMGDTESSIPVKDWIGLGSMRYDAIGFSNIRMPNDLENSTMYKYDIRNDIFPEEVFVHEFLHSLERNMKERQYVFPALHDNEKYGYQNENKSGLREWYKDYMQCNIDSTNGKTGLDEFAYTTKPVQLSDFDNSVEIEFENNPHNFIDAIGQIFGNLKNIITQPKEDSTNYSNYVTITTD